MSRAALRRGATACRPPKPPPITTTPGRSPLMPVSLHDTALRAQLEAAGSPLQPLLEPEVRERLVVEGGHLAVAGRLVKPDRLDQRAARLQPRGRGAALHRQRLQLAQ